MKFLPLSPVWLKGWFEAYNIPLPEFEYAFDPSRKWRADMAWTEPGIRIIAEMQGGVWKSGGHNRPKGYLADREKINAAQILGWLVLELTPEQFRTGEASTIIQAAMLARAKEKHAREKRATDVPASEV